MQGALARLLSGTARVGFVGKFSTDSRSLPLRPASCLPSSVFCLLSSVLPPSSHGRNGCALGLVLVFTGKTVVFRSGGEFGVNGGCLGLCRFSSGAIGVNFEVSF